ncbi:MAG: hypothetical protein SGPRY_011738 [Prymnesium sp.]
MYVLWPPHAGMALYRAAFGQDARVGISRLPLDAALLEGLSSEAELVQALGAKGDCYLEEVQLEAEVPSSSSKSGRGHEQVKPLKRSQVVVLDEESEGEVVEGSVHAALVSRQPINQTTFMTLVLQISQSLVRERVFFCKLKSSVCNAQDSRIMSRMHRTKKRMPPLNPAPASAAAQDYTPTQDSNPPTYAKPSAAPKPSAPRVTSVAPKATAAPKPTLQAAPPTPKKKRKQTVALSTPQAQAQLNKRQVRSSPRLATQPPPPAVPSGTALTVVREADEQEEQEMENDADDDKEDDCREGGVEEAGVEEEAGGYEEGVGEEEGSFEIYDF